MESEIDIWQHHRVLHVSERSAGLKAIIALHDVRLGRCGGGVRFYPYADDAGALRDALRLSAAMTYKFALAGVPFGGGKSVIIGDPRRDKTERLLEAFGDAVQQLGGTYICAEDVGTTPDDMVIINKRTDYVTGLPNATGDTSPATGEGVFHAINAAVHRKLGKQGLAGIRVAVQGAGNVGRHLCSHLAAAGAEIVVADVDDAKAQALSTALGATVLAPGEILAADVDVLAPCALGEVLDTNTISTVRAAIVCGGANNPLADDSGAQQLAERGVFLVPDYVANAGGVFAATRDLLGLSDQDVRARVAAIADTCAQVFDHAEQRGITPYQAAAQLAERAIEAMLRANLSDSH